MRLVKMREGQEALSISRRKLSELITNGEIPGMKIGGTWRIDLDGVERLIQQRGTEGVNSGELGESAEIRA